MTTLWKLGTVLCLPLLAACGASGAKPASSGSIAAPRVGTAPAPRTTSPARIPQTQPTAPATGGFVPPRIMNVPGLEGVIGQSASGLEQRFGSPDLDVREGDARKLQYRGQACVLDIYLYPVVPGAEATATYVEARRASDSLDVDRAACVAALRR